MPGESPPPPPRASFGRDHLIEKIVGLAENLIPIALIGVGGIGKTSIALSVLHNDRVKQRFGDYRRFIRCDQFPASCSHFLSRLSKATGAGVENPEDLTPLRPFLSSKEMLIVLDNAEFVLDPQGTDAQEIYALVEELSRLETICLCITSRISTVPPDCETLDIPTLSMESARDAFYYIYKNSEALNLVDNILEQLEFHPLSITLLATVAHHNRWDTNRLASEWEEQRTGLLHTHHNKSLEATVNLSFASPMFRKLGPDAQGLLGVVAFFPQGIDENKIEWLFPTISNRRNIFDNFCILSLTYRNNGFVTMLGPLRDYLCPQNPMLAPLLCTTKERYFSRLSTRIDPTKPGFEETRWITSEDVNVEHLLDVFTTIDANSGDVWRACAYFMVHLYWHKKRLVVLRPKIEGLPDNHPSKPRCLLQLSRLFESVGNRAECKRLLIHTLKLWRERGDDFRIAQTLRLLADVNRHLGHYTEGIEQAKGALKIYKQINHAVGQGHSLKGLAWLLCQDNQLDAAEEAASHVTGLPPDRENQFLACKCRRVLGKICHSKGETGKAINHLEAALGIASSFNWHDEQFWILCSLAKLFRDQGRFDNAHAQVERAKSHTTNAAYLLGRAMQLQADIWHQQLRFEEAKSEALRAVDVFEDLGATKDAGATRKLLRRIEEGVSGPIIHDESDDNGELLETTPHVSLTHASRSERVTEFE